MRRGLYLAVTGLLCLTTFAVASAAERVRGNKITASGCTSFQVPFCTILNTGKAEYSLVGANPSIPIGIGVTLVGEKTGDVSICFKPVIKVIRWHQNKMKCPK